MDHVIALQQNRTAYRGLFRAIKGYQLGGTAEDTVVFLKSLWS
jgi:hypothetical protein